MPPEPEPELLLPHPAASTPTAPSAASATSGRRSSPDLLGGGLLMPFQTRTCVSSFAGAGLCPVVHQLLWSPCRADLPPTMAHRRPGAIAASTKRRLLPAGVPAYLLAPIDGAAGGVAAAPPGPERRRRLPVPVILVARPGADLARNRAPWTVVNAQFTDEDADRAWASA